MDKKIEILRNKIYEYYESLLLGDNINPLKIKDSDFYSLKSTDIDQELIYVDTKKYVFTSGKVEQNNKDITGKTFMGGDVVERIINDPCEYLLIRTRSNGIIPLEEYGLLKMRPALTIPSGEGLVINLDSLEKNASSPYFKGKSVNEILETNIETFDYLYEQFKKLNTIDYMSLYIKKTCEEPLLF